MESIVWLKEDMDSPMSFLNLSIISTSACFRNANAVQLATIWMYPGRQLVISFAVTTQNGWRAWYINFADDAALD